MKKKTLGLALCGALACTSVFAGGMCLTRATEIPQTVLKNEGDGFLLTEQSYGADESFVYTSTVHFQSGQAGALVFGGEEAEGERNYWAFNIDRYENTVKLLYFYETTEQSFTAVELLKDYYIGNDKMTDGEKNMVFPKVRDIDKVQLKVVVSAEDDGNVYAEFYADNIRRFGVDTEIELNSLANLPESIEYEGGAIGFNCFNAEVRFEDTHYGASDYSYYTETYRQQYHFSQYAHWNNDPNGLVYYDGWYHLYYQHHPFNNYWGDMYWGHARSRDLAHWELLPICLFPDTEGEFGPGNGWMWSGSAMVYHKGMSGDIDELNWYPNGNGDGLIAFYTRDGGLQDQVVMSSDDGGMTWTKRKRIPQTLMFGPNKTDCRDPKVFPVQKDGEHVTLWGMALTGMGTGDIWFLKSENLLDWSYAGGFKAPQIDVNKNFRAECPDVVTLTADDNTTHTVMTFTGREYLVGDIVYDTATGMLNFITLDGKNVSELAIEEIPFQRMDFGPDSYATQSFYIDDTNSAYYGKTISVSWFSGVPGATASIESGALTALRKTWNGGGMTIPVEWGLAKKNGGYVLSQTPIVKTSTAFEKTEFVRIEQETTVNENSENLLAEVDSRTLEISALMKNPNQSDVSFKVQVGEKEYTEIGWTKSEGYFVDRTHTSDGGLPMPNYRVRYTTGATDGENLQFYILVDHGGVEVYCDGYTLPFYVLTFASPYARGASLEVSGEVVVQNLVVNGISSVWRDEKVPTNETVLYLSQDSVELSTALTTKKEVSVYATSGADVEWKIENGADVVSIEKTANGVLISALREGKAEISAICGNTKKVLPVTVHSGSVDSDVVFEDGGIVSGDWLMTAQGLVGAQSAGDGFILSSSTGADFTYTARFDLGTGVAGAIIFRAKADMSDYYIANYDKNGKIVKLWTPYGELAVAHVGDIDTKNIVLTATTKGNAITIFLNGNQVIHVVDTRENAPREGLFGLNVCATRATFSAVGLQKEEYEYTSGDLTLKSAVEQGVVAIYNDTDGGAEIATDFYEVVGREIRISSEYLATLSKTGRYTFRIVGVQTKFTVQVEIKGLPTLSWEDLTVQEGCNVSLYVGNNFNGVVKVNDVEISAEKYSVKNGVLVIDGSIFSLGENSVWAEGGFSATVCVEKLPTVAPKAESGCKSSLSLSGLALVATLGGAVAIIKGRKKDGDDD